MISRQVATVPKVDPPKKNVAVPLSPCTSHTTRRQAEQSEQHLDPTPMAKEKTVKLNIKSVQATSSSIDLYTSERNSPPRRSKSEEELRNQHFQEGILELLGNVAIKNKAKTNNLFNEEILKDMCIKLQKFSENFERKCYKSVVGINGGKKLKSVPVWIPLQWDAKENNNVSTDLDNNKKNKKKMLINTNQPDTASFKIYDRESFENIIKDWINDLSIKSHDFIGKPIEKVQVINALLNKLLKLFPNKTKHYDVDTLKRKIIEIASEIPLEVRAYNKRTHVNKLVEELMGSIKYIMPHCVKKSNSLEEITNKYGNKARVQKYDKSTEDELKELISSKLAEYKERANLKMNSKYIKEIVIELIAILKESMDSVRWDFDEYVKEELINFLCDTGTFSLHHSLCFTNILLSQLRKNYSEKKNKWLNQNFMVYQNTVTAPEFNLNELGVSAISQNDVNTKFEAYVNELCHQIDEWLTNLPIPHTHERGLKQVVINDLAGDIIDRHRYLQLNPGLKSSDSEELEHLRYQIYKWINKLFGEEQTHTIENAPDLMNRIQNIPIPILTNENHARTEKFNEKSQCSKLSNHDGPNAHQMNRNKITSIMQCNVSNQTFQANKSQEPVQTQCCDPRSTVSGPSIKELNDEYDEFVKNWIQSIPIPASNPEENHFAEKARLGIYNGIWKAVTKLKFDPVVFHNEFYYQDLLDKEIDELLDLLPKNNELDSKRHSLKAKLVEKTTNTNEMIKNAAKSASFRQQLVENVANNISRKTGKNIAEDPVKSQEELQILAFVEDFILFTQYKDEDKVKANVYRNKLLKNIEVYVNELKKSEGRELKDIDIGLHFTDIIDALNKVPLPTEGTIKEEADEILLGIEIEQWLSDLPIVPNDKYTEQLKIRRMRDALTKKIFEIQKNRIFGECASNSAVKNEISRFLEKIPLQQGGSLNINFMVEELTNRIKNKTKETGKKKSVKFQEFPSNEEFSKDMLQCSNFYAKPALSYQLGPQITPLSPVTYHSSPRGVQNNSEMMSFIVGGPLNISGATQNSLRNSSPRYMSFGQYRPTSSVLQDDRVINYDENSPIIYNDAPLVSIMSELQTPTNEVPVAHNSSQFHTLLNTQDSIARPNLAKLSHDASVRQSNPCCQTNQQQNYSRSQPLQELASQISRIATDQTPVVNQFLNQHTNEAGPVGLPSASNQSEKAIVQANISHDCQAIPQNLANTSNQCHQVYSQPATSDINQGQTSIGKANVCCNTQAVPSGIYSSFQGQHIPNEIYDQVANQSANAFINITPTMPQQNPVISKLRSPEGRPFVPNVLMNQYGSLSKSLNATPLERPGQYQEQIQQQTISNAGRQILNQRQIVDESLIPRSSDGRAFTSNVIMDGYGLLNENLNATHAEISVQCQEQNQQQITSNVVREVQNHQQIIQDRMSRSPERRVFTPNVIINERDLLNQSLRVTPAQYLGKNQREIRTNAGRDIENQQPIIEERQINPNTQQYGSSYGQPQGYSTPQGTRLSPPRIGRKRTRDNISRRGLSRRRLELEDEVNDDSDEDTCPCIERTWRYRRPMTCEEIDMEYGCYFPMRFSFPYYF